MVPASVYQMLRGAIVIITALLAVIFLKKKQYRHHISSLALIFAGLVIVGVSSIIYPDPSGGSSKHDSTTVSIGIVLLLIA